jgi:hypothetical protein
MQKTPKIPWLIWTVFGVLVIGSALCLLQAFAVVGLTPMMVYDSSETVPKLSDQDIAALCHSVSRFTSRVAGYSSAVVIAWLGFSSVVLAYHRKALRRSQSDEKKDDHAA